VNETIRLSGRTPDGGEGGKAEVRESEAKDAQGRKLWFVEFVVGGEGEERIHDTTKNKGRTCEDP
jgi:hypothetical protein